MKTNICEHNDFFNPDLRWKPTSVNTIFSDWKPKFSCKSTSVNAYCVHRLLCTGSGYISPYIPTWVIIQTFSISKSYTFSIVLPGPGQYWKRWFSVLVWQLELYFPILPSRWRNIDPYRPSRELCCGSTMKIYMVRRAILEEFFKIILFGNWDWYFWYLAWSSHYCWPYLKAMNCIWQAHIYPSQEEHLSPLKCSALCAGN